MSCLCVYLFFSSYFIWSCLMSCLYFRDAVSLLFFLILCNYNLSIFPDWLSLIYYSYSSAFSLAAIVIVLSFLNVVGDLPRGRTTGSMSHYPYALAFYSSCCRPTLIFVCFARRHDHTYNTDTLLPFVLPPPPLPSLPLLPCSSSAQLQTFLSPTQFSMCSRLAPL